MALWFTAMMLASVVTITAPTALAAHNGAQANDTKILIEEVGSTGGYVPYSVATHGPIRVGDKISIWWNATWSSAPCDTGTTVPLQPAQSEWNIAAESAANADASVLGLSATEDVLATNVTGEAGVGSTKWRFVLGNKTVGEHNNNLTHAEGTGKTITAKFTLTCGAAVVYGVGQSAPTDTDNRIGSASFSVDTLLPTLTLSAVNVAHDFNVRAAVNPASTTAAIGSWIFFNVTTDGTKTFWDTSAWLTTGGGLTQVTGPRELQVLENPGTSWKALQGNLVIPVRVEDAVGNPRTGTVTVAVDNVRPGTTLAATASTLLRNQDHPGFSNDESNRLWANFTGADVEYAMITVRDATPGAGNAVLATAFRDKDDGVAAPATFSLGDRNVGVPYTITLNPVDTAGNLNPAHSVALVFPNMNVAWGPSGSSPVAVSGTTIGSVYVNITSDFTPNVALGAEYPPGNFFSALAREGSTSADNAIRYWKNNTAGADADFDTLQADPTPAGTNVPTSNIRPALPTDGLNIVLTNYSRAVYTNRNFAEGGYRLIFNITGASGNQLIQVQRFKIDSAVPNVVNLPAYSNSQGVLANTNMTGATVVHGADGNPFKVVFRVVEDRLSAQAVQQDSGLKNVTFELFDPVSGQVVQRTSGTRPLAQVELLRGVGNNPCSANYEDDIAKNVVRTLPYCVDLSNWTFAQFQQAVGPAGGCGGNATMGTTNWNRTCLTFHDMHFNSSTRHTTINQTTFNGWVNLTFPDLPVGRYKVRVSAWDFAGLNSTKVYPTGADTYNVLPVVTIADEPKMTLANLLDVVPAASQRYANVPGNVSSVCVNSAGTTTGTRDVCPPYATRIYVTNNRDNGSEYRVPGDRTYLTVDGSTFEEIVGGFSGTRLPNGTLVYEKAVPIRYFKYVANTLPNLTQVQGLNLSQDIYVRAEAVALDGQLNEVTRKSDWVKVSSPLAAALSVPSLARDWAVNKTGDFPPLNITFDRKTSTEIPNVRYWINSSATSALGIPFFSVANDSKMAPVSHYGTITHWTTRLANQNGAFTSSSPALAAGAYKLDIQVYVPGATPAQDQNLSHATRFFIIQAQPTIDFLTPPAGSGIVEGPPRVAGRAFDVPFRLNHGEANFTDISKLTFRLTTGTTEISPGPTFTVTPRVDTGLSASATFTDFTASVTLPADSVDNDPYQLAITADVAETGDNITDATGFLNFRYDGRGPTVAFRQDLSEATVFQVNSDPKRDLADERPAFVGTVRDAGAGVKSMEVRIFDKTIGRTIRLVSNVAAGYQTEVGLTDAWANDSLFPVATGVNARFITLTTLSNGDSQWTLPLNYRGTTAAGTALPDLWANGTGIINFSHKYQIDLRATDNLDQVTTLSIAEFDFDAAPPTLGVGTNPLGTTSNMKSGIVATSTVVNWHTVNGRSSLLKVNVTDNQCLVAVYLLAKSDKDPSVTHQARMFPEGIAGDGRVCFADMPTQPNTQKYVTYALDLRDAPENMTDHVTNYTYWWKAIDEAGQVSEVPSDQRTFRMRVEDASPATVSSILLDPNPGQTGGRSLVRANVFDNQNVSRVTVAFHRGSTLSAPIVATANMSRDNTTADGVGWWIADTEQDLGLTLETGEYLVNITAFDINWNRTGSPTCLLFCIPYTTLYLVRDDGAPSTQVVSPPNNATVNATPTFTLRALHKNLAQSGITVRVSLDGNASNMTTVPASQLNFTELVSSNNSRQGWTVVYTPGTLQDNTSVILNISAAVGGLLSASQFAYRVDALPPTVAANVTGTTSLANKTWAVPATRVTLEATDNVSATTILFTVNGATTPSTYTGPITPTGDDGEWKLEYWARDAAGNLAEKKTVTLNIDRVGPRISVNGHGDEIVLTVTDAGVGVNDSTVTVHYRYGTTGSFNQTTATRLAGGNSFRALLPGNATSTGLSYYFTALDLLGNQGTNFSAAAPHTIPKQGGGDPVVTPPPPPPGNEPPTLQIIAPTPGQNVTGQIDITWEAVDPEGAPMTAVIARINPDGIVMAPAPDPGHFVLNVAGQSPGTYTIVITVSDGVADTSQQVTFNVVVPQTIALAKALPRQPVAAGAGIPLEVTINPTGTTVTRATYSLIRNGTPVGGGPLTKNPAGNYAAVISANQSGSYAVVVDVVYGNQTTESRNLGTVAVAAVPVPTPDPEPTVPFPVSLMALAAIAILVVPLAAYGAFGRWRK